MAEIWQSIENTSSYMTAHVAHVLKVYTITDFFFWHLKGTEKHEIYLFCRSTQNIYRNKHLKQQIITYLFKKLLVNENIYESFVFFHY